MNLVIIAQLIFLLILVTSPHGYYAIFKSHMNNGADDKNNSYRFYHSDYRASTLHTVKIFSRESTNTLKVFNQKRCEILN